MDELPSKEVSGNQEVAALIDYFRKYENILAVLVSGVHYDRITREGILKEAKMLGLSKAEIQKSEMDIDKYKRYELSVQMLAQEFDVTPEDIQLVDRVNRKLQTQLNEEEIVRLTDIAIKFKKMAMQLNAYSEFFGDITNE